MQSFMPLSGGLESRIFMSLTMCGRVLIQLDMNKIMVIGFNYFVNTCVYRFRMYAVLIWCSIFEKDVLDMFW